MGHVCELHAEANKINSLILSAIAEPLPLSDQCHAVDVRNLQHQMLYWVKFRS